MKKVIVTGFEPFGDDSVNPALEVIKDLAKKTIPDINLITLSLPVVFGKAVDVLAAAIENEQPVLVLSLGQAAGRKTINIEKIGININHARIADNEGNKPIEELINPNGPAAYFTTIDVSKTTKSINEAEIPALTSYSTSTYVCNNLIYGILHYLHSNNKHEDIKYGFMHIPYLASQIASKPRPMPSMSKSLIIKAVEIAIQVNI